MADATQRPRPGTVPCAWRLGDVSALLLVILTPLFMAMAPARAGESAPDAEQPDDMAFIEYLGSWEEDDSDWIALAGTAPAESERRQPSAEREQDEENGTDEDTD